MKFLNTLFILILLSISCDVIEDDPPVPGFSTGKFVKEISINGNTREYIIHIPQAYTSKVPVPTVLSFHGLGSDMENNYSASKFHILAENENFISVYPNGNSNQWKMSADNNSDVDFIEALLDQLENDYNIDTKRIYSVGMSNGGFFSFLLACQLSDRIAAIGSVTGAMYQPLINSCNPNRPISIIQMHGTQDRIVDYSYISNLLNFWKDHNGTNVVPKIYTLPDIDKTDGSTVERYVFSNGRNNVEVEHLKINNGDHNWPGYRGNMDIDATEELWDFLKDFNMYGKINR
jgi:polyhydroxybutyrate depolymerase